MHSAVDQATTVHIARFPQQCGNVSLENFNSMADILSACTLLERFWRLSLAVTDGRNCKALYMRKV